MCITIDTFYYFGQDIGKRDSKSRKIMEHIMDYVKARSIRMPSTLRMLRLVNAKTCENGPNCYAFNIVNGTPASLGGSTNRPFGMALCSRCLKGGTYAIQRYWASLAYEEPRIATASWNRILQPDACAHLTSDGPIVRARAFLQIENTLDTREQKKDAIKKIIDDLCGEEESEQRNEYESRAKELKKLWGEAERDADDYLAKKEEARLSVIRSKHQERVAKRLSRIRPIYNKMKELLEGSPMADVALQCSWYETSQDCLFFKCRWVRDITERMLSAPAGVRQAEIVAKVDIIRDSFTALSQSRVLRGDFLTESSNPIYRGMQTYINEELSSPARLLAQSGAGACV